VSPSAFVVIVYFLIGAIAFWPLNPNHLFGVQADYTESVWFLAWVPHALAHGLDPFFSNAIFVPTGANLAQNTSSPLLGLMTTPFAMFSPVVRANLVMLTAMPLSATAAFMVLRKWQVWTPAAAIGGLFYGFSPYMVASATGHPNLLFLPLPPLIVSALVSIVRRRGSPRRLGIQLGLLVTAQYLISPEVLGILAILAIPAVASVVIRHPEIARGMAKPVGVSVAVAAVLLAYPVWMMVAGPQHFTGRPWPAANPWHNDLLSFVVPGPLQRVSLGMRSTGIRLIASGLGSAALGYIGVPVLVIAGFLAWRSRSSSRMKIASALLVAAGVLTLGSHLAFNGRLTHIPLPFLALDHVPLLQDILPLRINFAVAACVAAVIAFGLDDINRCDQPLRRRSSILAVVTLLVSVATQLPMWPPQGPYVPPPAVALPPSLRLPGGDPVTITYPYATYPKVQPMLWQAQAGFNFRLLGGYAYRPTSSGAPAAIPSVMSPPGLQQFLAAQEGADNFGPPLRVSPKLVTTARATLARYDVRVVIVDRSMSGSGPVMELFKEALGPPKRSVGQFTMWAGWARDRGAASENARPAATSAGR
jgi:hypothetical protein